MHLGSKGENEMEQFRNGQRIGYQGRLGTVVRLRHCDDGAWVDMDMGPVGDERRFPDDDPHGRGRHVLLYPEDCYMVSS